MNRGPFTGRQTVDHAEKARDAWGQVPDWVAALADATNRDGLKKVSARLNYSRATVSQVIGCSYRGDVDRVESMVRGALMSETVICPVLGEMTRDVCLEWQRKPRAVTSSHRSQMYRACRSGCPHSKLEGGE